MGARWGVGGWVTFVVGVEVCTLQRLEVIRIDVPALS